MPYDAVFDGHPTVLVAEVLEEIRHVTGGPVNNGATVVGVAVLVFVEALLKPKRIK